jgi:molybdopterin converting factor small subunit
MITKQQVRDFVGKRHTEVRENLNKELKAKIDEKVDPILNESIDTIEVEKLASKLVDKLQKKYDEYGLTAWSYTQVIAKLNYDVVGLGETIKNNTKRTIMNYVNDPHRDNVTLRFEELVEPTKELQKECASLVKKLEDLTTLKREIERVIQSEPNGKRAYKALIALGVDMKDFDEEKKQNLPSVIKLSADVCLLNKTC